ncbi:MAG: tetratricopeptide repeat protein [Sphingobium sp.]|nr:tetratricopeptide repeat protein [Sphingobium sp.]MBP6112566.1 tetratricopeptide repeat protein [Sphingobium sp.]MBP8671858.1 tetratricopeptide repeat protein [Sphingobium sp.]MBP9158794.1 tetratricopeptide repeat protein [Sphingobium sp.]
MRHIIRGFSAFCLATSALALTGQAWAAEPAVPIEKRVERLEKEVRAVQRKVFPNGAPVEPDITATAPEAAPAAPASTPVSDLIARVTSLEAQLATQTGQVEQNSYRLKLLEQKFEELKAQVAPPPALSAAGTPAPPAAPPVALASSPSLSAPATPVAAAAAAPKPAPVAKPAPSPSRPASVADEARKAAIATIERPDTGDAANDAYTYGFRLWSAKFYPEAQTQLKTTLEKFGTTSVGSRAQNLLGRAYLDDGKPALASVAFYENYRKRPEGDRTAQSLTYLGEALIQLKKPADACKVYDELQKNYGSGLTSDLRTMMEKGRVRAKCGT